MLTERCGREAQPLQLLNGGWMERGFWPGGIDRECSRQRRCDLGLALPGELADHPGGVGAIDERMSEVVLGLAGQLFLPLERIPGVGGSARDRVVVAKQDVQMPLACIGANAGLVVGDDIGVLKVQAELLGIVAGNLDHLGDRRIDLGRDDDMPDCVNDHACPKPGAGYNLQKRHESKGVG